MPKLVRSLSGEVVSPNGSENSVISESPTDHSVTLSELDMDGIDVKEVDDDDYGADDDSSDDDVSNENKGAVIGIPHGLPRRGSASNISRGRAGGNSTQNLKPGVVLENMLSSRQTVQQRELERTNVIYVCRAVSFLEAAGRHALKDCSGGSHEQALKWFRKGLDLLLQALPHSPARTAMIDKVCVVCSVHG
jgi:hypothetical protein